MIDNNNFKIIYDDGINKKGNIGLEYKNNKYNFYIIKYDKNRYNMNYFRHCDENLQNLIKTLPSEIIKDLIDYFNIIYGQYLDYYYNIKYIKNLNIINYFKFMNNKIFFDKYNDNNNDIYEKNNKNNIILNDIKKNILKNNGMESILTYLSDIKNYK
jgi:hypothetical protein